MSNISQKLESQAVAIRLMLSDQFRLSPQQIVALPSLLQIAEVAHSYVGDALPEFFQSIMSADDRDWMEEGPKSDDLMGAIGELKPERKIPVDDNQQKQWGLISRFGSFNINYLFALNDPFEAEDPRKREVEQGKREARVLTDYVRFCLDIIESRNLITEERSAVKNVLLSHFPITADQPFKQSSVESNHQDADRLVTIHPILARAIREIMGSHSDEDGEVLTRGFDKNGNPIHGPVYWGGASKPSGEIVAPLDELSFQDQLTHDEVIEEQRFYGRQEGQFHGPRPSLDQLDNGNPDDQGEYSFSLVRNRDSGRYAAQRKNTLAL